MIILNYKIFSKEKIQIVYDFVIVSISGNNWEERGEIHTPLL
jgi:hypothetical protein